MTWKTREEFEEYLRPRVENLLSAGGGRNM